MTRKEAYELLLRKEDATEAQIQEVLSTLGDNPAPTDEDNNGLASDQDLMDDAGDFGANPENFAKRLPDGPKKTLLLAYVQWVKELKSNRTDSSQSSKPAAAANPTSTSSIIDDLAGLLDSSTGGIKSTSAMPSWWPIDNRMRIAMVDVSWPYFYKAALEEASKVRPEKTSATLDRLRHAAEQRKNGTLGEGQRDLGRLQLQLLRDLQEELDVKEPDEFRRRYSQH